jgi:hypothetical protein
MNRLISGPLDLGIKPSGAGEIGLGKKSNFPRLLFQPNDMLFRPSVIPKVLQDKSRFNPKNLFSRG